MSAFLIVVMIIGAIAIALFSIAFTIFKMSTDPSRRKVAWSLLILAIGLSAGNLSSHVLHYLDRRSSQTQLEKAVEAATNKLADEFSKDFSARDEEALILSLEELAADRQIAAVLVQSVLSPGTYYRNYSANITLNYLDGPEWKEETKREWLAATGTIRTEIHNPTQTTIPHPLQVEFFDLGKPEDPPQRGLMMYDRLTFTPYSKYGERRDDLKTVWDKKEISDWENVQPDKRRAVMSTVVHIGPGEYGILEIQYHNWERMSGYFSIQTRYKTVDMSLGMTFPAADFDKRVNFAHPKTGQRPFCAEENPDNKTVVANIHAGLLPYQGITISWTAPKTK